LALDHCCGLLPVANVTMVSVMPLYAHKENPDGGKMGDLA
jgi:hypothetical protein